MGKWKDLIGQTGSSHGTKYFELGNGNSKSNCVRIRRTNSTTPTYVILIVRFMYSVLIWATSFSGEIERKRGYGIKDGGYVLCKKDSFLYEYIPHRNDALHHGDQEWWINHDEVCWSSPVPVEMDNRSCPFQERNSNVPPVFSQNPFLISGWRASITSILN